MTLLISILVSIGLAVSPQVDEAPADSAPEVSVPFACGRSYPVSQAHDTGSHLNNDTWAWDFRMPEGIPITAAADGVVRLARGDSTSGGCGIEFAKDANYVVIAHAGGLETQYLHFSKVVVKPGDHVKAGDLIGYSGKTGWACGSHLHFKVARAVGDGWNNPSLPAHVKGYGDPQTGDQIDSVACTADHPYVLAIGEGAASDSALVAAKAVAAPNAEATTNAIVQAVVTRVEPIRGASSPSEQIQPALATKNAVGDQVMTNK